MQVLGSVKSLLDVPSELENTRLGHLLDDRLFPGTISTSSVQRTYGEQDLGALAIFEGDFINFGYWKHISLSGTRPISIAQKRSASVALYRMATNALSLQKHHSVLELGVGRGSGLALTARDHEPADLCGIDLCPQQLERTRQRLTSLGYPLPRLLVTSADDTGLNDCSMDRVYGIECAQCFPSMWKFAREMHRILRPGGRVALAAHWATSTEGFDLIRKLTPSLNEAVDRHIPIDAVRGSFLKHGFREVQSVGFGQHVFPQWERWRCQQFPDDPFGDSQYRLFQAQAFDYYLVVYEKPGL